MSVQATRSKTLLPHHLVMLRDESGLPVDVIEERGYYSAETFAELRRLGFSDRQSIVPALVIPLWGPDGEAAGYQIRPDTPRQDEAGKIVKYETPRGTRPVLDVPPRCKTLIRDPEVTLYITEGSKKADALAARGLCVISLSGVANWRGKNEFGGKMTLADWNMVPLNGRAVRIAFDSDVSRKRAVAFQMLALKNYLERKQAVVEVIYLPDTAEGEKQGIDDFFAAGGTVDDLAAHLRTKVDIPPEEGEPTLPEIVVSNRHLRDIAQDCWVQITEANERKPFAFQRGGRLVRVDLMGAHAVIREWTDGDVHFVMERHANFVRWVKSGDEVVLKPARLPEDVTKDILAAWHKPLPVLKAIVRTPILSKSGRISTEPGYQPASEIYYDAAGTPVPDVPDTPEDADLGRANSLIDEWLWDFPFVDASSRANMIAIPLTYILRELIEGPTPLFVIAAPTQGTGKGLLAQTAGVIMQGAPPAVTTEASSGEEWRKRITAQLIEGAGIVLIDNVKRRLQSAELAAALTTEEWSDRLLGKSETVHVPNRAVWMATGNNIQLDGEIARRSVSVRIDAKRDRPWEDRTFRHPDLLQWVRDQRQDLAWAFLVLGRHWLAKGTPDWHGSPIGSFESWSRVVGGVLQAAGIEGFLDNREELYRKADAETEEWRDFVSLWWERHSSDPVKAQALAELVVDHDLLSDYLAGAKGEMTVQSIKIRLGKALSHRDGRRIGAWFIRAMGHDKHQKGKLYALELAEGEEVDEQPSANPPRENQLSSDSVAEDAEDAESVFNLRAREPLGDREGQGCRGPEDEEEPNYPPHSPHSPQPDSNQAESGAEGDAEGGVSADDSPRCRGCGLLMSVVRVSEWCPYCRPGARGSDHA